MKIKILKVVYCFICTIIILAKECYGYLDPSAMTYVIQIVIAIGITIATSASIIFYKIRKFIKNKKNGIKTNRKEENLKNKQ